MFVTVDIRDQVVARFLRGSFSAEKLCAHVVVDPKDTRAVSHETPHAFRANQSRRTCDDDRTHDGYRSIAMLAVGADRNLACLPIVGQARSPPASQVGCVCYSSMIHVTFPADGFTRAAGNCGSPASTFGGFFDAPTRNKCAAPDS